MSMHVDQSIASAACHSLPQCMPLTWWHLCACWSVCLSVAGAVASGLFMVALWVTGLQPAPRVDKQFLVALLPVALFHTIGHVSACVSFSQVTLPGWMNTRPLLPPAVSPTTCRDVRLMVLPMMAWRCFKAHQIVDGWTICATAKHIAVSLETGCRCHLCVLVWPAPAAGGCELCPHRQVC